MPVRRRRRQATTDGDARELILDAAEDLIARHGFDATPTAKIADVAGVPKGLVFYYFPGKADILAALLRERLPLTPIADVAELVRPADPAGALLALEAGLNLRDHHSRVLRVIVWREAETHPDVREHQLRLQTSLRKTVVEVLRASAGGAVMGAAGLRAVAAAWVSVMFTAANTERLRSLDGAQIDDGMDLVAIAHLLVAGVRSDTVAPA